MGHVSGPRAGGRLSLPRRKGVGWAGGLPRPSPPADHSLRLLPSHLGFRPHTSASRVFVSSIFTSAHAGALPWTHFKPGLPLSFGPCKPLRSLPTPRSCSCTWALQSWTHLSPSSTEARPHLLGSLGLTTELKQPAPSCSPVALHSVWLLGALRDLQSSPSSTLNPERLRLLPFLTAFQALGWAQLSPPLPSHLWPSPPGADAAQVLSNLSYPHPAYAHCTLSPQACCTHYSLAHISTFESHSSVFLRRPSRSPIFICKLLPSSI